MADFVCYSTQVTADQALKSRLEQITQGFPGVQKNQLHYFMTHDDNDTGWVM